MRPTRRSTLAAVGAALGPLAGCTLGNPTTFEAVPATAAGAWGDGEWTSGGEPPADRPYLRPTAGAQLVFETAVEQADRTVTTTSYGVTHSLHVPADRSDPSGTATDRSDPSGTATDRSDPSGTGLGEVLTLATPSIDYPGVASPAADLDAGDVVGSLAGTTLDGAPLPGGTRTVRFDDVPTAGAMLRASYGGLLGTLATTEPLEQAGGGVSANGLATLSTASSAGEATSPDGHGDGPTPDAEASGRVPCSVFGRRFDHRGDHVFVAGWLARAEGTAVEPPLAALSDALLAGDPASSPVAHPETCSGGCPATLRSEVQEGRTALLRGVVRGVDGRLAAARATTDDVVAGVERMRELLAALEDGDDSRGKLLEETGSEVAALDRLAGGIREDLGALRTLADGWAGAADGETTTATPDATDCQSTAADAREKADRGEATTTRAAERVAEREGSDDGERATLYGDLAHQMSEMQQQFSQLTELFESMQETECAAIRNMRA
jgi:hypothetical protein